MFDSTLPMLDVQVDSPLVEPGQSSVRVLVVSEEPYASEIAEQIAAAESWDELPMVEFEEWQVQGEGR